MSEPEAPSDLDALLAQAKGYEYAVGYNESEGIEIIQQLAAAVEALRKPLVGVAMVTTDGTVLRELKVGEGDTIVIGTRLPDQLHHVALETDHFGMVLGVQLDGQPVLCDGDGQIAVHTATSGGCMVVTLPLLCRAIDTVPRQP